MANKNPSPATRLGQPGGPKPGKRPGQRALEIENAEIATRIRNKLLAGMAERIEMLEGEALVAELRNELLKLLKDTEDRGLGSPKQAVDHTSTDGSLSMPTVIQLVAPK